MQGAAIQACKVQAALAKASVGTTAARTGVQTLRPQAPSFIRCRATTNQSVGNTVTQAVVEAPSSSNSAAQSERPSPPSSPRRTINNLKFLIKFIVPNSIVGGIMGKGGENCARIYQATGAFIQLSKSGSAVPSPRDRMLTIAGDDARSVKNAMRMLLQSLQEVGIIDRLERTGKSGSLFIKQVIPGSCAGKVLGPGGDQIQTINATVGVSVIIEAKPSNAAFIPFRYINYMAPTADKLADGMDMVIDLLEEDERYAPGIKEINTVAFKIVKIPEKRVGSILGPGGTHIQTLQDVLRVKLGICQGSKEGGRYVAVWGAPSNVYVALDVIAVATGGLPQGANEYQFQDRDKTYYEQQSDEENETGEQSTPGSEDRQSSSSAGNNQTRRRNPAWLPTMTTSSTYNYSTEKSAMHD